MQHESGGKQQEKHPSALLSVSIGLPEQRPMRALAENLGNRTPDRDRLREETRARPRAPGDLNLDARAIDFHWKDLRGTATSIWRKKLCSLSTTLLARKCNLCLRYDLSPMSPGRTSFESGWGERI